MGEESAIDKAKKYYDSTDADNFYYTIWGGEDLHLGVYETPDEPIFDASMRIVEKMASKFTNLNENSKVIDLGSGYGGVARYLVRTYGCYVVALNLSEVENERNRKKNKEQGLDHLIEVVDGNFEELPYPDEDFDCVWSEDSFLHSPDRAKVIQEATRVMKKGGEFVFTDPMAVDDCPQDVLQPILERIHLDSLATPSFYRETAKEVGLEEVGFEDLSKHLYIHYGRVLEETERREEELREFVSQEYIDRMKKGLENWVKGGKSGYLIWGIFHFRKK